MPYASPKRRIVPLSQTQLLFTLVGNFSPSLLRTLHWTVIYFSCANSDLVMTIFFFQNAKDFFSNDIDEKRTEKLSYSFLLKVNSGLKTRCKRLMLKRKIPFLSPTRGVDSSQSPHHSALLLSRHSTGITCGCVFVSFLPPGLL